MPRSRIKISFDVDVSPEVAMDRVAAVMKQGRISKNKQGVEHYCWATTFTDGLNVYVYDRKRETGAHSFLVTKNERLNRDGDAGRE